MRTASLENPGVLLSIRSILTGQETKVGGSETAKECVTEKLFQGSLLSVISAKTKSFYMDITLSVT